MKDTNKSTADEPITDEEIRNILADRVDNRHQNIGIAVGVIDENGSRVITYGQYDQGDPRPLDGDSVFEIGSVTKVFTKLLLTDMVHNGEVSPHDPVAKYLRPEVSVPERNGKQITLAHLAMHASGLPRTPDNIKLKYQGNPFEDFSVQMLYRFLSSYTLTRDPGEKREYSNLGVGLLGHVLALKDGTDYESLVVSRICEPLGMMHTRITFTPEMKAKLVPGHDEGLTRCDNWDFPALEGAGNLRSSVNDLLIFLSAQLGFTESSLAGSIADAKILLRISPEGEDMDISLGWGILKRNGKEIYLHHGSTGGYCSSLGFCPITRTGAIVLTNTGKNVDDIMMHILDKDSPLSPPPAPHAEIEVDTTVYDAYTGKYQWENEFGIRITNENGHLFSEATGLAKYELFPEAEHTFFYKTLIMQLVFVMEDDGTVPGINVHMPNETVYLNRVE